MKRPKIAILTPLVDFSSSYSLCGIILDQARMFDRHDYEYDLLVLKNFNKNDIKMDGLPKRVRAILPQTVLHDYQWDENPRDDFDEQIDVHYDGRPETGEIGYKEALEPYDVIITHDLMFLGSHLCQNAAIRRCVEMYPNKHWLHWIHSAPSGIPGKDQPPYPSSLRFQGCENSTYVFLNNRQRQDVANHFQIKAADVAVVYNFKDPRDYYGVSEDVDLLIKQHDLLNHEILQVYPFSTPRWESKGVSKLLRIWGYWRRLGINAKLVLVNSHANNEKDEVVVRKMEDYARKCDLTPGLDVIWTSRFAANQEVKNAEIGIEESIWSQWKYSVPFKSVRELVQMSNLFIFPSESECCSLIQAEASISGKFMVLNRSFLPMLEFGSDNILAYDFHNDPNSNPAYYECLARELWGELQRDSTFMNSTKARTRIYNRDWVFKNQLEPLLNKVSP